MRFPWASLVTNPDFRALFEADNSPIKRQIDSLTRDALSPRITDSVANMRDKATLHGILEVRRAVEEAAKAELQPESTEPTQESLGARAIRLGRTVLPRRLG